MSANKVEHANFDFFILDPTWFHVVRFTAIVAGAGAVTEWIDGRLVPRWRDAKSPTLGASVMLMLGALFAVPLIGTYFSEDMCGCDNPLRVAGTLLVAALGATAFTWQFRWKGVEQPHWLRLLGWGASAGAVSAGLVYVADSIAIIL